MNHLKLSETKSFMVSSATLLFYKCIFCELNVIYEGEFIIHIIVQIHSVLM